MSDLFKYISPLVLLALIISILGDFCMDVPAPASKPWISPITVRFNPFCYVKNFDPGKPKTSYPYQPTDLAPFAATASGTSLSNVPYGTLTKLS